MKCCKCGSQAINHNCHGRDGSDDNLCDVCYWRKRADELLDAAKEVVAEADWVTNMDNDTRLAIGYLEQAIAKSQGVV